MAHFSPVISDFWHPKPDTGAVVHQDDTFTIIVNPDLTEDRRVTILTAANGVVTAALTPAVADRLGLASRPVSEATFRQALVDAGVVLHSADRLVYFTESAKAELLDGGSPGTVRQLGESDAEAFAEFESGAPEEDRDEAYVELDHWAVFGSFEGDRLVAVASSYPWGGARLADIGVLTLPEFRGRGHGRAAVHAVCRHAYGEGYEPQYRCQIDNHASVALATSAGLTLLGTWEVVTPDAPDADAG